MLDLDAWSAEYHALSVTAASDLALTQAHRAFEEETIQGWTACAESGLPWAIWAGTERGVVLTTPEIAEAALRDERAGTEAT